MRKILLCLVLLYATSTFSQPFQKQFGQTGDDLIYRVVPAGNNEHFLLGSIYRSGGHQVWLMKIDAVGNILWTSTYEFKNPQWWEIGNNLYILPDSTMIIAGDAGEEHFFDDRESILIKIDKYGGLIWKKYYTGISGLMDVVPEGNGFIAAGYQDRTAAILHVDSAGNEVKRKFITFNGEANIHKIIPGPGSDFFMVGRANVIGAGYQGLFIWKVNSLDEIVWSKIFETYNREDNFRDITELFRPGLGVKQDSAGTIWIADNYSHQIGLFGFDTLGNTISSVIYGQAQRDEWPTSLLRTRDFGWLITGVMGVDSTFALKINAGGKQEWLEYYGKHDKQSLGLSGGETENHFLIAGMVSESSQLAADGWLLGVEKDGNPFPYAIRVHLHNDLAGDCRYTPGDIPLAHWFVMASDSHRNELLLTDLEGKVEYKTDAFKTLFRFFNPNEKHFELCQLEIPVYTDPVNPVQEHHNVVYRQTNCAEIEVGLTQPDLIRCDTSSVIIALTNHGTKTSEVSVVRFEFDPSISLISVSENYTPDPLGILITIPPVGIGNTYRIKAKVSLSCDVQLGAAHRMAARLISDNCEPAYSGPVFEVAGECIEDKILFTFGNAGGGGQDAGTFYNLYVNDLPLVMNEPVTLGENDVYKILEYPADGRTWRLEILSGIAAPGKRKLVASVEGCGQKNTGLHDVGYTNGFSAGSTDLKLSEVYPLNSTGVPYDITEAMPGMLRNNYVSVLEPMEYTLRVKNTLDHVVDAVSASLDFRGLNMTTFHPLASNVPIILNGVDNNTLQVRMEDLNLSPGEDAMVRFRVSPYDTLVPTHNGVFFGINGYAFLDDSQPVEISPSHHYYVLDDPALYAHYADYPADYKIFNARRDLSGWEFSRDADGSFFITGSTDSYGDYYIFNGFVIKTDANGKVIWQTVVKVDDKVRTNIHMAAPTGDGGCIFAGEYLPVEDPFYLNFYHGFLGRLDAAGNLMWYKVMRPVSENFGTYFRSGFRTKDGNVIVFGTVRASKDYPLILKFDLDGNILWQTYLEQNNPRASIYEGFELEQGGFVFYGANANSNEGRPVILTLKPDGSLNWIRPYNYPYGASVAPTSDKGFMLAIRISKDTLGEEYIVPRFIKLDSTGLFQWQKDIFFDSINLVFTYELIPGYSGGFLAAGEDWIGNDIVLYKVNDQAELEWYRSYGNDNDESPSAIINDKENEIWILGRNTIRTRHDHNQTILIKTDGNGITSVKDGSEFPANHSVLLFPNPSSELLNVLISHPIDASVKWLVVDFFGRILKSGEGSTANPLQVSTQDLIPGHYCIVFPGSPYPAKKFIIAR